MNFLEKYEFNMSIVNLILFYFSISFMLPLDSCVAHMSIYTIFHISVYICKTSVFVLFLSKAFISNVFYTSVPSIPISSKVPEFFILK